MPHKITVGLLSDTHGLLRPEALDLLKGSDFIVHAGDIGDPEIVAELSRLTPGAGHRRPRQRRQGNLGSIDSEDGGA
jgi:predicted phosphodiesterase